MRYFGDTDAGRLRKKNEDCFTVRPLWDDRHILAVVADGVGGYAGGAFAAEKAVGSIVSYLESSSNGDRLTLLKEAVVFANNTVLAARQEMPEYGSMCCVLTAVLVELDSLRVNMCHVGDSRLYQFSDGVLRKMSHDHSLVGYREEVGELTEQEAMNHPQRNVINRDIGSVFLENGTEDYMDVESFELAPSSGLLLCSDGLSDMLTSSEMTAILETERPVEQKVKALIQAANDAGGKDNVSVVLLEDEQPSGRQEEHLRPEGDAAEAVPGSPQGRGDAGKPAGRNRKAGIALLVIFLIVLVAFLMGFLMGKPLL